MTFPSHRSQCAWWMPYRKGLPCGPAKARPDAVSGRSRRPRLRHGTRRSQPLLDRPVHPQPRDEPRLQRRSLGRPEGSSAISPAEGVAAIPVSASKPHFVIYSPLTDAPAAPEVVLLFVRADQTLIFSEASQQTGRRPAPCHGPSRLWRDSAGSHHRPLGAESGMLRHARTWTCCGPKSRCTPFPARPSKPSRNELPRWPRPTGSWRASTRSEGTRGRIGQAQTRNLRASARSSFWRRSSALIAVRRRVQVSGSFSAYYRNRKI